MFVFSQICPILRTCLYYIFIYFYLLLFISINYYRMLIKSYGLLRWINVNLADLLSPNVKDIAELSLFYFKNCIYLDGSGFCLQRRQGIFLFSKTFRPASGSTKLPIQWAPDFSSSGVKQPRHKFNHFSLVLKLKMSGTIRLSPHIFPLPGQAQLFLTLLPIMSYKLILYWFLVNDQHELWTCNAVPGCRQNVLTVVFHL
jgi:hypothetical protein